MAMSPALWADSSAPQSSFQYHNKSAVAAVGKQPNVVEPGGLYRTDYDSEFGIIWARLQASCPARFTPALIQGLREFQMDVERRVRNEMATAHPNPTRYQVFASDIPGIFSLGGDLELFQRLIKAKNKAELSRYALECVDLVHTNVTNYRLPVTTISLVQGTALGGGFEAALAANVVVAERSVRMGLPEVMFNMFPGMGAYQLLTRRLTPVQAERMILSGRTYTAEDLYDMGVIDIVAEDGQGEAAVYSYIRRHSKQAHGEAGLRRLVQQSTPIDYDDMRKSVEIWVETALGLSDSDLRHMDYLIRAQRKNQPQQRLD
ncbi:MAG: crotonase/enoyl-CoA hydratase family protein [Gammaproteobacteria bacterium]|nr:crotonase/enoyl-CoA hydratase family protein [Gammaproteobacteria bacterium]MDH3468005.1 crotonase/enoyl-CoA hydratase family protein [Gammaproteobacteria bacterium]